MYTWFDLCGQWKFHRDLQGGLFVNRIKPKSLKSKTGVECISIGYVIKLRVESNALDF